MMRSRLLTTSMVIAGLLVQQALAAQSCDDALMAINTCVGGEVGEITPDQLACLRSVASDAEREMNAAYQQLLQITAASARRNLASPLARLRANQRRNMGSGKLLTGAARVCDRHLSRRMA